MVCPACGGSLESLTLIHGLGSCPACLRTLTSDGETVRLATADDTVPLAPAVLTALRKARATLRQQQAGG